MQFCPQCGTAAPPDKKFCTSCGASLTPDMTVPETGESPGPKASSPVTSPAIIGLVAVGVLAIVILAIVFVIYPMLTGSGILSATGTQETPLPTSTGSNGSYVDVITPTTKRTYPPTEVPVVTTTTPAPTTIAPTTLPVTTAVICPSDKIPCNNQCVDLRTDTQNCGYCGTACSSGQFCLNGNCMMSCTGTQTSCPDGCFDLQSDRDHCGTCLNNCPAGLICSRGLCTAPATHQPVPI